MRLTLLIGPVEKSAMGFRRLLWQKKAVLERMGVLTPDWNHVRLYAACAEADAVSSLKHRRGLTNPLVQQTLTVEFRRLLKSECRALKGDHVVIAAAQLGSLLHHPAEVARLHALLAPHFDDIRVVAHVEDQARALTHHYNLAILDGRRHSLDRELKLAASADWWSGALTLRRETDAIPGLFDDVQHPPFWLDYVRFLRLWEDAFGHGRVMLCPLELPAIYGSGGASELARILDLPPLGGAAPDPLPQQESAASLARIRQMNAVLIRYARVRDIEIPRDEVQRIRQSIRIPGAPIDPGSLHPVSAHFDRCNEALIARFPELAPVLRPAAAVSAWREADPGFGFRATQYLAAHAHTLDRQSPPLAIKRSQAAALQASSRKFDDLLHADDSAKRATATLLNQIKVNHEMVLSSQFRPHNDLGTTEEVAVGPAFTPAISEPLAPGSTGNVIVACMKDEAPYILEWIAYHRAIGVDHFLIYTNDCSDGTDRLLDRLACMGVVEHRKNDDWRSKSPQQHALKLALDEPIVRDAEWIIHIDVDEFINVRIGNGTLSDFFAAVPDATNVAMTWRLFGHNDVRELHDAFVIDQFDACAPKHCPKPHIAWGFKSMVRNIGAYGKLSCHRPNKLARRFENKVKWVNGSGRDITRDTAHNGWRSSKRTVGYDLLQLNHYALRSAQSFLIKRQRGRALHVDRSIGINYWIRMDWSGVRDRTIKRNIPRLRVEYDRLMQDPQLKSAHETGFASHRTRAAELQAKPEYHELHARALTIKLNETERVAYALALDMDS